MNIFRGCMPALMTPCDAAGSPDFDALVATGRDLVAAGMSAVIYCGSMGDWPLLTDGERVKSGTGADFPLPRARREALATTKQKKKKP
jgi:dihydrodipicolinate synthase/N-acetylneuraminate lyase